MRKNPFGISESCFWWRVWIEYEKINVGFEFETIDEKINCVFEETLYTSVNVEKRSIFLEERLKNKIYDRDGNLWKREKETRIIERKMMNV